MGVGQEALVLEFDGSAGSVRAARRETSRFLSSADPQASRIRPETMVNVQLVAAELVANACRHTSGPGCLRITLGPTAVEVAVEDTGPPYTVPEQRLGDGGYGLMIVARLAFGDVQVVPLPTGKVVRAAIPLRHGPESNGLAG